MVVEKNNLILLIKKKGVVNFFLFIETMLKQVDKMSIKEKHELLEYLLKDIQKSNVKVFENLENMFKEVNGVIKSKYYPPFIIKNHKLVVKTDSHTFTINAFEKGTTFIVDKVVIERFPLSTIWFTDEDLTKLEMLLRSVTNITTKTILQIFYEVVKENKWWL